MLISTKVITTQLATMVSWLRLISKTDQHSWVLLWPHNHFKLRVASITGWLGYGSPQL